MPLYVDGQEMKCFVNGQQMNGYVNGVHMFGQNKTDDGFGNDALLFRQQTWIDTGAVTVTAPMEVHAKVQYLSQYFETVACLFGSTGQNNTDNGTPWIAQIIYNTQYSARYVYQNAVVSYSIPNYPLLDKKNHILKFTNSQYTIDDVPILTLSSPQTFTGNSLNNKIYLGVRYNPAMPPYTVWYFAGYVFGFKILSSGALVRNFIPVNAGSTKYSSTPAPSVCMWDTVTQQYYENQGTTPFEFVTPTPS